MLTDIEIQRVIRQVAKEYGQTPTQVRKNMQAIVDEGRSSMEGRHKEAWALIPHYGENPTLEDVIRYMAARLAEK